MNNRIRSSWWMKTAAGSDRDRSLEEIEKEAIFARLKATYGNKVETARRLGITRETRHNKLKCYER